VSDWPGRYGRDVRAEVDSTNAEALRLAAAGERGPVWILAHRQSAARGRRGRPWASPPGNFSATLLIRPEGPPAIAALRSFVAALALRDALVTATARPELFSLKWPNDVLLAERKLAGILLEASGGALAIGFGVNLATAPTPAEVEPGAVRPVALTEATGVAIGPEAFLDLLGPAYDSWETRLGRDGFAPLREAWLAHAARLGQPVTARLPGREVTGAFETIDATGAMVLSTAGGRVALPAAEIHFGAGQSGGDHAACN
jgi:BirA family biotin operon repressor/biotin-[acetyl-CoA-carboxylase] ligase